MEFIRKSIMVEDLIELVADKIWSLDKKYISSRENSKYGYSTLKNRLKVIEDFKQIATFENDILSFQNAEIYAKEIPAFNYLLFECDIVDLEDKYSNEWERVWKFTGFSTFENLYNYIMYNEPIISGIFVKNSGEYVNANFKCSYINNYDEVIYTDEYEMYNEYDEGFDGTYDRNIEKMNFEIIGLCEYESEYGKVWCSICMSLDEVYKDLEGKMFQYYEKTYKGRKKEIGVLRYEGKEYNYSIDSEDWYKLFDEDGNEYCNLMKKFDDGNQPECKKCYNRNKCFSLEKFKQRIEKIFSNNQS